MLLELNIENFAIIEKMKIEFTQGLNVITGETGSGKSIIIDSLGIVLGARASKDIIKTGKDHCYIEAIFSIYNPEIKQIFVDMGMELGDLLVISKEIRRDRPSITRVNGRVITTQTLALIVPKLIDIFAQHESVSLMDTQNQKELLDSFGDSKHKENLDSLRHNHLHVQDLRKQLEIQLSDESNREREMDLLRYQKEEIEQAQLTEYDESSLEEELMMLENVTETGNALNSVLSLLKSDYDSFNVEDGLDRSISSLQNILRYNPQLEEFFQNLEDIRFQLREVSQGIESYADSLEFDAEKLSYLQNRIDTVNRLKVKYGKTIQEIYLFLDKVNNRLAFLDNYEENLQKLREELEKYTQISLELAEKITQVRLSCAEILESDISREMQLLNIPNAKFKVHISDKEVNFDGKDEVEFLISTNLGEEFKSLSKVASGGEMSRIMLGFKSIIANKDDIPTLVFDEIDTGISGKTAQIVGNKIRDLAKNRQVIVISHLPQIVSLADSHFLIEKNSDAQSTKSQIRKLQGEERVEELARLIGGMTITKAAMQAAREMIS